MDKILDLINAFMIITYSYTVKNELPNTWGINTPKLKAVHFHFLVLTVDSSLEKEAYPQICSLC